ncbi:fumarylacetoacetate hydrolase family protein [Parahaliea mediterranea]|uniref:Fumarylacetoacetate hydrolase family protein n=1 Tax=Parahaliea mediterranea TaxID=651086 RepID=A0A939DGX9_9GAMM|nr:fumarylacetoacetate hydrolase family protein [Parahaliea mediterranea]
MNTVTVNNRPLAPSKIVCVGRNYVAHIEELGNEVPDDMVVFLKPNSAIGEELRAEFGGEPLHYEGELAFAVAAGELAAVGFGLDLTRRDLQGKLKAAGLPWERAKAFDGAALFSDFVPLPAAGVDGLGLELEVDGQPRQRGDTSLMLYPPRVVLEQLAGFMRLEDGDILMTGTPAGVGPVRRGETFTGRVVAGGRPLVEASWQAR